MPPPTDPFADTPDPACYVPREASERALAALLACLQGPARPALLLAPPGLGKTLLLHLLERRLEAPLRAVYVPNPVLTPAELCAWTLGRLGSPPWSEPIGVLGAYLEHCHACGSALVWLIDDAHGLPEETARWIGQIAARSAGALRVVAAAVDDERVKGLEALGPVLRVAALARAMEPGETARYVFERLVQARVDSALRARCHAALDAIQEVSAGVPREVNSVCSRLLASRLRPMGAR